MKLTQQTFMKFRAGNARYQTRIKALFGSALIGCWPLWEPVGATDAEDISGNGRHGKYTGVELANAVGPKGYTVPYFDGSLDYVDIFSPGLAGAINPNAGTLMAWMKPSAAGDWSDATVRAVFHIPTDAGSYYTVRKTAVNNQLEFVYRGMAYNNRLVTYSSTDWTLLTMTWAYPGSMIAYINTTAQAPVAISGAVAGNITSALIGANNKPGGVWRGWEGFGLLLDRVAIPAEIGQVHSLA